MIGTEPTTLALPPNTNLVDAGPPHCQPRRSAWGRDLSDRILLGSLYVDGGEQPPCLGGYLFPSFGLGEHEVLPCLLLHPPGVASLHQVDHQLHQSEFQLLGSLYQLMSRSSSPIGTSGARAACRQIIKKKNSNPKKCLTQKNFRPKKNF